MKTIRKIGPIKFVYSPILDAYWFQCHEETYYGIETLKRSGDAGNALLKLVDAASVTDFECLFWLECKKAMAEGQSSSMTDDDLLKELGA